MFQEIEIKTVIRSFKDGRDLTDNDNNLLQKARQSLENAYAPYSRFLVGAAIKLKSGIIITGNNQENVAYPSGLCAERVAIFSASANYPCEIIETIAISARALDFKVSSPVPPCGSCRQAMAEYERKQTEPIRVLLQGETGVIYEISSVSDLLPLIFEADALRKE